DVLVFIEYFIFIVFLSCLVLGGVLSSFTCLFKRYSPYVFSFCFILRGLPLF
ncbi:hypothetical protein GIB67_036950, partial [Kingdonia uniflora]